MRLRLLKIPRDPRFALVSVKRSSLSLPLTGPWIITGCGCQLWGSLGTGVEWSPLAANTGRRKRKGEITAEAGELTKRTGPEARLLASVSYKREVIGETYKLTPKNGCG